MEAPAARWPLLAWLAGSVGILGWNVVRLRRLGALRRRAVPCRSDELLARLGRVAECVGLSRRVAAVVSPDLVSPCVFGLVRPVLALPAGFERAFTTAQQEAVIAHELGHLANRDPLWGCVATGVVAVAWWNPFAWWACARHRSACELAADDVTAQIDDGPGCLAEGLVVLGRRLAAVGPTGSAAVGRGGRSNLARRVRRLLAAEADRIPPIGRARRVAQSIAAAGAIGLAAVVGLSVHAAAAGIGEGPSLVRSLWEESSSASAEDARVIPAAGDGEPVFRPFSPALARRTSPLPMGTDEEIFGALDLSAEQFERLRTLRESIDAATRAMYRMSSGREARGLEINRDWREGLQAVLTPDQYRRYREYWRTHAALVVRVPIVPAGG